MPGIHLFPLLGEIMGKYYSEKIFNFTYIKVILVHSFKSQIV